MRLPSAPLRLTQPECGHQADIRTLYLCDRHSANQMYAFDVILSLRPLTSSASLVVLSAIQDILLQLHLRECGLL
jgi:hypothetical protein